MVQAVDYISLYLFIVVVYGGALLTDYAVFSLMWYMVREDAQAYPLVAQLLNYAKIGLAILFIFGAVAHGILSTVSQVKLDYELARGEQESDDYSTDDEPE